MANRLRFTNYVDGPNYDAGPDVERAYRRGYYRGAARTLHWNAGDREFDDEVHLVDLAEEDHEWAWQHRLAVRDAFVAVPACHCSSREIVLPGYATHAARARGVCQSISKAYRVWKDALVEGWTIEAIKQLSFRPWIVRVGLWSRGDARKLVPPPDPFPLRTRS